jgi:predicted permease
MSEFIRELMADIRHAARSLVRRPSYTALVVATLGLGIGASAAVFGALDRVILRPLPYPDAERFVYLSMLNQARGWNFAPFSELIGRWREGAKTIERIETYRQTSAILRDEAQATQIVDVTAMSGGMPGMLGVRPLVGRLIGESDAAPGSVPAVMVSERYWRGAWGGAARVVGRTVVLNDTIFTVAGVWPEAARLDYEGSPSFFRVVPAEEESPLGDLTLVLARKARGVMASDVEAELSALMRGMEAPPNSILESWLSNNDLRAVVDPPYGLLGDPYVRGLWMVFAGGIVLLVVAVFNTANLVLGRSASRSGEIAIRLALGGSGSRLVRLFFAESALLAGMGMLAGFVVAVFVEQSLARLEPGRLVPPGATGLQGRATLFAFALATTTAVLCALVPLLHARTGNLRARLAGGGSTRDIAHPSRLRGFLIGAQSALAVLLITGAALVGRSFASLLDVDVGLDLDHIAVLAVRAPSSIADSEEALDAFFTPIEAALRAIPGVLGITTAPNPPLAYSVRGGLPFLDGEPEPVLDGTEFVSSTGVQPGHFDVTGIPILRGRDFHDAERGVIIVNDAFARTRAGDVLGRSLRFPGDTISRTIIAVAGDVRSWGLEDADDRIQLYYPASTTRSAYTRLLLRTSGPPSPVLRAARARMANLFPGVPLREARTGPELIRERTARIRFVAFLLGAFAALGVVFAITGVYGAVTLDVSRRAREVSVRIALGASHHHVRSGVLRRGLRPVLLGAIAGTLAALWAGPLLESVLFRVHARDPLSLAVALVLLIAAAAAACLLPARRASRVDPATALRAT